MNAPPYTPGIREARQFSSSHDLEVAACSGFLDSQRVVGSARCQPGEGSKSRLPPAIGLPAGGSRSKTAKISLPRRAFGRHRTLAKVAQPCRAGDRVAVDGRRERDLEDLALF